MKPKSNPAIVILLPLGLLALGVMVSQAAAARSAVADAHGDAATRLANDGNPFIIKIEERPAPRMPQTLPRDAKGRSELLSELYGYLADAKSAAQAQPIVSTIKRLWLVSESPTTDLLMARAQQSLEVGNLKSAQDFLSTIVKLQPEFTEAWNRRAYVLYRKNAPHRALSDLRRVLSINPNHFEALESVATILSELGEKVSALEAFRKLRTLHPQAVGVDKTIEELSREVEGEPI